MATVTVPPVTPPANHHHGSRSTTSARVVATTIALKDGARIASTNNAAGEGPGRSNLMAAPTSDNLQRLAHLLDTGALEVHIQQTYPLDQAAAAMNALATTHTRGKLALHFP